MQLTENEYISIKNYLYKIAGIDLSNHRMMMVQSRLIKRVHDLGLPNFKTYFKYLQENIQSEQEIFLNALTTNKTDFFRENKHFEFLRTTALPKTIQQTTKNRIVNIWSAACSTGAEVYTLAMTLYEFLSGHSTWKFRLLGTDINTSVLHTAEKGVYPSQIARDIPPAIFQRYFVRSQTNRSDVEFRNDLRDNIKFRIHNLMTDSDLPLKFDFIFLRNVLIYFDPVAIEQVIKKMSRHLKSNGFLFLGHSETLNGIPHDLKAHRNSIYQKDNG